MTVTNIRPQTVTGAQQLNSKLGRRGFIYFGGRALLGLGVTQVPDLITKRLEAKAATTLKDNEPIKLQESIRLGEKLAQRVNADTIQNDINLAQEAVERGGVGIHIYLLKDPEGFVTNYWFNSAGNQGFINGLSEDIKYNTKGGYTDVSANEPLREPQIGELKVVTLKQTGSNWNNVKIDKTLVDFRARPATNNNNYVNYSSRGYIEGTQVYIQRIYRRSNSNTSYYQSNQGNYFYVQIIGGQRHIVPCDRHGNILQNELTINIDIRF